MHAACLAGLLLHAAVAAQASTPEQTLALHLASLGGRAALATGDLLFEGTIEQNAPPEPLRIYVRAEPFGYREEVGSGERMCVFLCDGQHAWTIVGGRAELSKGSGARSLLDFAFLAHHGYLEPGRIDAWQPEPGKMWDVPGTPEGIPGGRLCLAARARTTAGNMFALHFDAADGALHAMVEESAGPRHWTRFGAWKKFGAHTLPTLRADGLTGSPVVEWRRFTDIKTGLAHDPALFPPPPVPELAAWKEVTSLEVVPTTVPGSALLVVPELRLNGATARHRALFDTGISELGVAASLAAGLRLSVGASEQITTPSGVVSMGTAWLDSLDLDGHRWMQLVARSAAFPMIVELSPEQQPVVHLGGPRVMACAPLLDLERRRLILRRSPAPSWNEHEPRGGKAVSVALQPLDPSGAICTVEVGVSGGTGVARVMLDAGYASVLRLTPSTMKRLGLPREREAWLRRGALPVTVGGVSGAASADLIVQLDSVVLGPIVYEKPWVIVGFVGAEDDEGSLGLLGTGALLPFARVAIDPKARRLELEPRAGLEPGSDGKIRVPSPGTYLGFGLLAPGFNTVVGKNELPLVCSVAPGSLAAQAGLREADLLEALDGQPVRGVPMDQVCRKLWVAEGARLVLTVRRQGESNPIEIRLP